jgi:hypothetical protein
MCCGQKRLELRKSQGTTQTVTPYRPGIKVAPTVGSNPLAAPTTRGVPTSPRQTIPIRGIEPRTAAANSTAPASIRIRYVEKSPISVRGIVSGTYYQFSDSRPVHPVDARDASVLLNTRLFRRA